VRILQHGRFGEFMGLSEQQAQANSRPLSSAITRVEQPSTLATDGITRSLDSLHIAVDAIAEIAAMPGTAGDRAMQALRDIKQVVVDGGESTHDNTKNGGR
jgi:hypothetical protein